MTTMVTRRLICAAAAAAALTAGCGLSEQDAPAVSGPSEFGQSISVAATPDRLSQDGVSQARVDVTVRDASGKPVPGVTVKWSVVASTGVLVEPSAQQSTTDPQGRATIFVTAPAAPAFLPSSNAKLMITAEPVGTDALSTINSRTVEVVLVPPAGTLPPNRLPVAAFSIAPVIGNINQEIRFDASLTMDEGEPCNELCTYQWDFGDFETNSGRTVTKSYGRPETYTVTLTVTDNRGGVSSTKQSLTINGPKPPEARLTITPASAVGGTTLAFNAGGSTVGIGATIERYVWEFGDGTSATTTTPVTSKAYPVVPMESLGGKQISYPVVLTIFDNFGRSSVATATATALPTPEP
jgi:PKD repeat protein